jgi:hypothetical protein
MDGVLAAGRHAARLPLVTAWTITGSRPPNRSGYTRHELLGRILLPGALISPGDTVITGGCLGVDAIYMEYAHNLGAKVVTLLPQMRAFTDMDAVRQFSDEVEDTGLGYWARDTLEVQRCDKVLAFPCFERLRASPRSGTWHTWDVAAKAGKEHLLVVIRPMPVSEEKSVLGPGASEWEHALERRPVTLL